MAEGSNDFQIKLDQFRKEYKQNLPSKIDEIRDRWSSLRNGDWNLDQLIELLNLVHRIAGSGGVYGFSKISEVACKLESLLQEATRSKKPMGQKGKDKIEDYLEDLREAINSCND